MDKPETKLSGAQLHEQSSAIKREVVRILDDTKLRQFAVEQAVKVAGVPIYPTEVEGAEKTENGQDLSVEIAKTLTQYFYDFITNKEA